MKILHFPLTKITIGFVLGILLFPFLNTNSTNAFTINSIGFSCLLLLYFLNKRNSFFNIIFGLLILINSFFIGITTASINKQSIYPNHYSHSLNDIGNNYQGTILIKEKLKSTEKNHRYVAEIKSVNYKHHNGKLIFNLSKNDSISFIPIGSILQVKAVYYQNKKPFNPNQFEYGKYLEHQEIYGQLYSKNKDIKIVDSENSIRSYFANHRDELIVKLKKTSLSKSSISIIEALFLGQKQDVSPQLLKEYQSAGAVHILAVSGLHVGIILIFLTYLLNPISNSRKGRFVKLIIIILSLWCFALLAGLSPSIVRAVTMFSVIAIGTNLKRTVNIYHTILVSVFIILLINPSIIYDIGFQMSYLAVFFIVWLQPILKRILTPKNKILNYFWDILTVSTAAQIGVLPLSIFCFHQFPGLFFLTNLVVLPLLFVIMGFGFIVLLFVSFGWTPNILVKALDQLVQWMNQYIHWVASFDTLVFKNIPFSKEMLIGFYLTIIFIVFWLIKPSFKRISFALISVAIVQIIFIYQKNETLTSSEGIIFNQKKNTIITERICKNVTLFANDSILNSVNENSTLQSYLIGNFSTLTKKKNIANFLYINNKKVMVIDSSGIYNSKINPDILIITQSPKINLDRVLQIIKPKIIIADGSNYKTYSKHWEATCRKQKILFHNTHEKGFYKF